MAMGDDSCCNVMIIIEILVIDVQMFATLKLDGLVLEVMELI